MDNYCTTISSLFAFYCCVIFAFCTPISSQQSSRSYLEKQDYQCQKLLSKQTQPICHQRMKRCCENHLFETDREPLCATTTNGFGMIFNNTCSLYLIRCMYPRVCFLKRRIDHPHCNSVYPQLQPLGPPCEDSTAISMTYSTMGVGNTHSIATTAVSQTSDTDMF